MANGTACGTRPVRRRACQGWPQPRAVLRYNSITLFIEAAPFMIDVHILPIALTIILVGWSSWRFAASQAELQRERRLWLQGCLCIAASLVLEALPVWHVDGWAVVSIGLLLGGFMHFGLVLCYLQEQDPQWRRWASLWLLATGVSGYSGDLQLADALGALALGLVFWRLSNLHWQIERHIPHGLPILTTLYGLGAAAFGARLLLLVLDVRQQAVTALAEPLLYLFASTATIYGSFGFLLLILRRRNQRLVRETLQDGLTGVLNRRGLDHALQQLQQGMPLYPSVAIAMLDVDHFKQVNDRYGHAAGDEVLRQLAQYCRQSLRSQDVFARYGGEEFCVLMPGASLADARRKLDQLREAFATQPVLADVPQLRCTFSAGLVCWDDVEVNPEKLLHQADDLLYQAKRAGRNCVMTAA